MPIESAVVILVLTLALSCIAVVSLAVYLLVRFSRQLSLPLELALRQPYRVNPDHYGRMAYADAIAASPDTGDKPLPVDSDDGPATPLENPSADAAPMMSEGWLPSPDAMAPKLE